MNVYALQKEFQKIKKASSHPSVIATLPSGKIEIDPKELLDFFLATIRLGDIPHDHELFEVFQKADEDKDQGLIFGCLRKLAQGIAPSVDDGDMFLPRLKQADSILQSVKRLNIWYGAVRSSKTIMSLIRWLEYCIKGPKGRLMMVGNTLDTLELNCIEPLIELLPSAIRYTPGWTHCFIFGRKVRLRGANDVGQERKFRGPTLAGAYGDELTTWAKQVWKMLLTRLSRPGAMLFGTTNPDQPLLWLNVDVIERAKELSCTIWHFILDDNPGLTEEYKADLIRENPPGTIYYYRFILGLWVAAEGAIYKIFDRAKHIIKDLPTRWHQLIVGVDYGSSNPTAFIMLGLAADGPNIGKWIAWKEYYYADQKKVDTDFSADMGTFLKRDDKQVWHPSSIEVDPSAASFRKQLKKDGFESVHEADNSVLDGIRNVAAALAAGKLLIHESCQNLIRELQSYVWDAKAQERGLEMPLKQSDHANDALRYACRRIFSKGVQ